MAFPCGRSTDALRNTMQSCSMHARAPYRRRSAAATAILLAATALVVLCTFFLPGCRKRNLCTPTPQINAPQEYWVRVLLHKNLPQLSLAVRTSFSVRTHNGRSTSFEHPPNTLLVRPDADRILIGSTPFKTNSLLICPDKPYVFSINGSAYRGNLKLILHPAAATLDAINIVPLEPYLAGVVGAEMPDYWDDAALQAQAVAARTYCLYIKKRFGTNRQWDLRKTQANQVYLGLAGESARVWAAVNATRGKVLMCTTPTAKAETLFPTYYSSACGGHTEDAQNVFGEAWPPLQARPCPYCRQITKPDFFLWPAVIIDQDTLTQKLLRRYPALKKLGRITQITPVRTSTYDTFTRITSLKLTGSTGAVDFLRAEDFRLTLDPTGTRIRSTIFRIEKRNRRWFFLAGRGYGHGVGMCQCGAEAMARRGFSAAQILQYYYPGSRIVSLY